MTKEKVLPMADEKFSDVMRLEETAFLNWCRKNPLPSKSGLSPSQVDTILYRLGMIQGNRYLQTGKLSSFKLK